MGLDLIYTCEKARHTVRISEVEVACLKRLSAIAPVEVDILFETSDFGESTTANTNELLTAIDTLLTAIRDRADLLPSTYQMRKERLPLGYGIDGTWQGGAMSGLRLPGDPDYFSIRVGPDCCELTRMQIGADGRGIITGTEDLRGRESIQTETVGRIDFRQRPTGTTLRKHLTSMRAFFAERPAGSRVTKVLC